MNLYRPIVDTLDVYKVEPEHRENWIRLDLNENLWGCSPHVLSVIHEMNATDVSMYPESSELVSKLASYLNTDSEMIELTNGGDDALLTVFMAVLDPGNRILMLTPSYSLYEPFARLCGADVETLRIHGDFSFPETDMENIDLGDYRMVVLAHPNNPTGTIVPAPWLERAMERYSETVFFIDEAYVDFLGMSFVEWVPRWPNLVIARTFSKVYGLAGMRLGYIVAHHAFIQAIRRVHPPFSVNAAAIRAGMAALEDQTYRQQILAEVAVERDFVAGFLRGMGWQVDTPMTNFILVDMGTEDVAVRFVEHCRERGILVKKMAYEGLTTRVRVTLGPHDLMVRFIETAETFHP